MVHRFRQISQTIEAYTFRGTCTSNQHSVSRLIFAHHLSNSRWLPNLINYQHLLVKGENIRIFAAPSNKQSIYFTQRATNSSISPPFDTMRENRKKQQNESHRTYFQSLDCSNTTFEGKNRQLSDYVLSNFPKHHSDQLHCTSTNHNISALQLSN